MSSATMSIPAGSWVLVTGGSGFLASHICLQLLYRGFRVRATVRDPAQSTWLLEGRFQSFADTGAIELVSVPDLGADGAYDEAIKGVSAILHTAYVTNVVPDPNEVITPLVNSITSVMRAATQEPLVKEVVFTGSALNSSPLKGGVDNGVVGRDSWNDGVLEAAWAPPPYDASRAMLNYPASKVAAEKEVWKFVKENEVPFNVHVISPAGLIGEPLHKKHIEGQANWVVHGYRGHRWAMDPLEATFYADVKDVALVHVAVVLDPEVKHARIQAWGHNTHWNEILAVFRKLRPQRKFVDDYPQTHHLKVSVDQTDAVALMKKWSADPNRVHWRSLEDSIHENIINPYLEE